MIKTDSKLLRVRDNLILDGKGVIALEIWSIVKLIMLIIEEYNVMIMPIAEKTGDDSDVPEWLVLAVTFAMIGAILAVSLVIRLYAGRSAVAEGHGKKVRGKNFYLIVTGVLALLDLSSIVMYAIPDQIPENDPLRIAAALLIDALTVFIEIDLIVSALKLRKMTAASTERR